jgi:hypothetical protein
MEVPIARNLIPTLAISRLFAPEHGSGHQLRGPLRRSYVDGKTGGQSEKHGRAVGT